MWETKPHWSSSSFPLLLRIKTSSVFTAFFSCVTHTDAGQTLAVYPHGHIFIVNIKYSTLDMNSRPKLNMPAAPISNDLGMLQRILQHRQMELEVLDYRECGTLDLPEIDPDNTCLTTLAGINISLRINGHYTDRVEFRCIVVLHLSVTVLCLVLDNSSPLCF